MKLIRNSIFRSASFCSRIIIIGIELTRAFIKRLGTLTIAGKNWIDFACRVPIIRKLPLSFKLFGYRYIIFISEMPLCYFVFYPEFEKSETELVRRLKPKVFIDVGSHMGYYTMLVHKLGAEKIIAVDADARTLRILTRAIAVNKLKNIITIHRAVFDKSNVTLKLHLSTIAGRSSVFSQYLNLKNEYGGASIVKTITLDEIAHALKLERIDMVKIDVEGAEYNVLWGANHVINRFRPIFLVEVKSKNQEDIFKFFRANRYKVLGPLTFPENYLFIPVERDYMV